MDRVAPSERIRQELLRFLSPLPHVDVEENPASGLVKLAARLVLQEAMEKEQADFLGGGRYERTGSRKGYRNGYEPGHLDTAEGRIDISVPQVRDTDRPFRSRLLSFLGENTEVFENLVVEMYARGLSTRDIEDAFTDATGRCLISKSGVSEITDTLWEEYEAFSTRDLSDFEIEYLFLDGIYESLRLQAGAKEALLCAWGICSDGQKVLLHLSLGNKESYEGWLSFLRNMVSRGLCIPVSVTSDGAPGLIRAIEEVFGKSIRIRCWMHKVSNILSKVPDSARDEVKSYLYTIRDAPTLDAGREEAADVINLLCGRYPSAIKCLEDDLEASLAHLRLPVAHRKYVRTTNLIERSFLEERRRTKVIPRFFDERSCLKLAFGTLIRASRRWQRVRITELEQAQLMRLRQELGQSPPPPDGRQGLMAA